MEYYGLNEQEIEEMKNRGEEFADNAANILSQYAKKSDEEAKIFYADTKDNDITFKWAGRKALALRGLLEKRADGEWMLTGK